MHFSKRHGRTIGRMSLAAIMALAVMVIHDTTAKGEPLADPEPDFVIETLPQNGTYGDFFILGALVDSGRYKITGEPFADENGEWVRYKFYHRGTGELTNFFEALLPLHPERNVTYAVVLTAGPDGYSDGVHTYFDDWAVTLVTGREVNVAVRQYQWGNAGRKNYQVRAAQFTINGFFAP